MSDLIALDFYGHTISTCQDETTKKVYCVPREIVRQLGLSWGSQYTKLAKSKLYGPATRCFDIETPGGKQAVLLLDIEFLPSWLASISAHKVRPEIQAALIQYQTECAGVLRDYWTQGVAVNPRAAEPPALPEAKTQLALIDQAHSLLAKLGQLTERDTLMLADQVRNIMTVGQRLLSAPSTHADTPQQTYGFSIAERVEQLGYHLARTQQAAIYPQLGKRIAEEWRSRYDSEPAKESRWVDGAQRKVAWYAQEDSAWIDPIVQSYLSQFPGLARTVIDEP